MGNPHNPDRMKPVSNERVDELLAMLQSYLDTGGSISVEIAQKEQPGLVRAIYRHVGKWPETLERLGYTSASVTRKPWKWHKEAILSELEKHADETGRLSKNAVPGSCYFAATREFGSWDAALDAVGLKRPNKRWSKEAILAELKRHARGVWGPTIRAVPRSCHRAATREFGSWDAALDAAGFKRKYGQARRLRGKYKSQRRRPNG